MVDISLCDEISQWIDDIMPEISIDRIEQLSPALCAKPRKDTIGGWLSNSLSCLNKVVNLYRKLKVDTEPLKTELIKSQQQVITLQGELLASKNDQIQSLQSSVKTSVEETVKAEFITYSAKLQTPPPSIAADTVKTFVKTVVEEEDRSRSLMLFGLPDSLNEQLTDKVNEVFQEIGEKPRFEASRLGFSSSSGSSKKVRPVKVTFSSSTIATQILSRSRNLKKSVKYQSVFPTLLRAPDSEGLRHKSVTNPKSELNRKAHQCIHQHSCA